MNPFESYQSDAMERPLIRRRLFWALVASLIVHAGIVYWFHQTYLPQFHAGPVERLVPREIFKLKTIRIDENIDNSDKPAEAAKPKQQPTPVKPLDLPDDKPVVNQGRMVPTAPAAPAVIKPIQSENPVAQNNEAQEIARIQNSAKSVIDQDKALSDSLLRDQPANIRNPGILLPPKDAAASDARQMAAAAGQLERDLASGLRPGDAPVTMPGGALFEFDKAELRPAAMDQLHLLGNLIKKNPKVTFTIEGYSDSFGDAQYNIQLSQARADAVRTWLIQNVDVDPAHIRAIGYGATRFLVAPKPVDMHSQESIEREKLLEQSNRRVEIKFQFPSTKE